MKLDEKYFIPFIGIIAVVAALLIVYYTVSNREGREQAFRQEMSRQDSLRFAYFPVIGPSGRDPDHSNDRDSVSVASFTDTYVIIDFWATWTASFSEDAHEQLARLKEQYPGRVEILAAVVEDKAENVRKYRQRHDYPFRYVDGTGPFNKYGLPGVPTQLVYAPGGQLHSIFSGYADSLRMDSLQTIIGHE